MQSATEKPLASSQPISPEAQRACESTVLNFMLNFDAGNFAEMEKYFADDGQWVRADGTINGVAELAGLRDKRPAGILVRHVISNMVSRRVDGQTVRVSSYVTVYRAISSPQQTGPVPFSGPSLMGRYTDDLALVGDVWKIKRKTVDVDFTAAASLAAK